MGNRSEVTCVSSTGVGNFDCASNTAAHICDTARASTSRSAIGGIPDDSRDLGDIRIALCEAEIGSGLCRYTNSDSFRSKR